jgi:predicted RND superfamily exporter protein
VVERFARVVTTHRRLVAISVALVALVLGIRIPAIDADFTPEDLFAEVGDEAAVGKEFEQTFGNTDNLLLVVVQAEDVLAAGPLAHLNTLTRSLSSWKGARRVASITNAPVPAGSLGFTAAISGPDIIEAERRQLLEVVVRAPLVRGRLLSEDHTVAVIAAVLSDDLQRNDEIDNAVREVEKLIAETATPDGVDVRLGGLPYVRSIVIRKMKVDQGFLLPLSFALCFVVLLVSFRWVPAVVLPLATVGVAAACLVGGMAWVGEDFNILNNIIPLLVIIIGISDSIHVLSRYGEELADSDDSIDASRRALRSMAVACFYTSMTTAVGFGSLVLARTSILRSFALTAVIGIAFAYLATITLLPALLAMVAPPRRIREARLLPGSVAPVIRWLIRRRRLVLVASLLALVGGVVLARGITVEERVRTQFDDSEPISLTLTLLEEKLGGVRPLEAYLVGAAGTFDRPEVLDAIDSAARWAFAREEVLSTTSYGDFLRAARFLMSRDETELSRSFVGTDIRGLGALLGLQGASAAYVSADRSRTRLTVSLADIGSSRTISFSEELVAKIREHLAEFGVEVGMTGEGIVSSRGLQVLIHDLAVSLGAAIGIIFLFLAVMFRSVRLGLLSIPPNVIPLLFTLAYMRWRDIPLSTATVIIFSISIGLAVDGTIHMLARFREEIARGLSKEQAVVRAADGTGKAIIATSLTLVIGFGVLQWSEFVPIRRFGELIAVTVVGCLLATLLVLPPLLYAGWRDKPQE